MKQIQKRFDWETIALPLVLMLTGIILLFGNWFGLLSLDRIQNLWPGAVIVIGLAELMPIGATTVQRSDGFDSRKNFHAR